MLILSIYISLFN